MNQSKDGRIMRINKDLADAVMMVSAIILVLVGTTPFHSEATKNVVMGVLGLIVISMGAARYFGSKKHAHTN